MSTIRNYAESLATADFRPKLEELLTKPFPPMMKRFLKEVGLGINSLQLINAKDSVLVGISGGKDSLVLALSLALRKRWLPIDYKLEAVQILWKEYPMTDAQHKDFEDYFGMLGMPYTRIEASMFAASTNGKKFNCYVCSRNRKRLLFAHANKQQANKIALGHHKDDIVQTTLMNMIYQGTLSTMMPKQAFFDGKFEIVRPMCECQEKNVINIAEHYALPVISIGCPYRDDSARADIKPLVASMEQLYRGAKENMYRSLFQIKKDYLPGLVYGNEQDSDDSKE